LLTLVLASLFCNCFLNATDYLPYTHSILGESYVENISSDGYMGDVQVWDITTDGNEMVFLATAKGLSVYDGLEWKNYTTVNTSFFRSLYYDPDNRLLYAAADNEFGAWERNEYGHYEYRRFYQNQQNDSPEIFWKIIRYQNKIYFQTRSRLYTY
ncbi:MAG: hypothetical protein LUD15_02345, partial [Bacteroides sp.]|nr:hypothetical protein [Bacteroides sp.]